MHLNLEEIIDVSEGRSKDRHTDECPDCRRQVEEWQKMLSSLHRSQLTDAPDKVLEAAYGIPAPRASIGQVLASMIFDSFAQPALAGARGSDNSRQVVLRATEFDIHVRIAGKPKSRQIIGQILSRGNRGFVESANVHLLHDGKRIQSAVLDPLGEFEFANTPDGPLSLQIDLPNLTVIGPLEKEENA